jgi:hypothetical protein
VNVSAILERQRAVIAKYEANRQNPPEEREEREPRMSREDYEYERE